MMIRGVMMIDFGAASWACRAPRNPEYAAYPLGPAFSGRRSVRNRVPMGKEAFAIYSPRSFFSM
jgi:hypothetical protein